VHRVLRDADDDDDADLLRSDLCVTSWSSILLCSAVRVGFILE
jgi:hypothetical protein